MKTEISKQAKAHWDAIAKPIDSLGLLEEYVVKLCEIQKNAAPPCIGKRALLVLCGDHGVVNEGVTQTGQEVTKIVAENFAKNQSSVNIMAGIAGVDVFTIDMGMNTTDYPDTELKQGVVVNRKIARGTKNLAKEPAMTLEECNRGIATGKALVKELKTMGYRIIATGEMGIGNTTPTSALAAYFLDVDAALVTGKGAGLSENGINKKCKVIKDAIRRVKDKGMTAPAQVLAELGGFEIAAMVGVYLGAVEEHLPVVMDGVISVVAGLVAYHMDEEVADYLFASHVSMEPASSLALKTMGLEGMIHGRMCLGEGTGAMTLFPILDMAVAVYANMGSFTDYAIDPYQRFV